MKVEIRNNPKMKHPPRIRLGVPYHGSKSSPLSSHKSALDFLAYGSTREKMTGGFLALPPACSILRKHQSVRYQAIEVPLGTSYILNNIESCMEQQICVKKCDSHTMHSCQTGWFMRKNRLELNSKIHPAQSNSPYKKKTKLHPEL